MSSHLRDRQGSIGHYAVVFLAGMLATALIVLAGAVVWRQTRPSTQPSAPSSSASTVSSSSPPPSIDPHAGDYQHDHDTLDDEKPQWEPAVLGFAKNFTNTDDNNATKWRQRLAPYVAPAVQHQLADIDQSKVPAGRYDSYELLKTGNYQIAAKITYREGWGLVLYVTSDGTSWRVTAYDRFEQ